MDNERRTDVLKPGTTWSTDEIRILCEVELERYRRAKARLRHSAPDTGGQ